MPKAVIGKPIPAFKLDATENTTITHKNLKKQTTVLYFYPKDNTPGCTLESQNFRDNYKKFTKLGCQIIGVSRDDLNSHEKFKLKQELPFELIADTEDALCNIFDVIKLKNMYGKKFKGIERSTFLIDSKGILRQEWRKVKVKGHVDEVLAAVKNLD